MCTAASPCNLRISSSFVRFVLYTLLCAHSVGKTEEHDRQPAIRKSTEKEGTAEAGVWYNLLLHVLRRMKNGFRGCRQICDDLIFLEFLGLGRDVTDWWQATIRTPLCRVSATMLNYWLLQIQTRTLVLDDGVLRLPVCSCGERDFL